MKLILIMICDEDKDKVQRALVEKGYTPTLIATTGDFLEFGKSVFLLGVDDHKLEELQSIIDNNTKLLQIKNGEHLKADMYILGTNLIKEK